MIEIYRQERKENEGWAYFWLALFALLVILSLP